MKYVVKGVAQLVLASVAAVLAAIHLSDDVGVAVVFTVVFVGATISAARTLIEFDLKTRENKPNEF